MTAYYLKLLVDKIPGYKAPIHFKGGAFEVFALSLLALAANDFLYYWFHRLQHSSKWLWAEHELHHSDEHMSVTTSLRHHWLEPVLQPIFVVTPVLLIFKPALGPVIWLILFQRSLAISSISIPPSGSAGSTGWSPVLKLIASITLICPSIWIKTSRRCFRFGTFFSAPTIIQRNTSGLAPASPE